MIREILVTLAFMAAVAVFGLPLAIGLVKLLVDLADLISFFF